MAEAGVEPFVLATSDHAGLCAQGLGDGSRCGVLLDYVLEDGPLGTGGAIRNVAAALTEDPDGAVIILNGDVLSGHDLPGQLADFRSGRRGRRVAGEFIRNVALFKSFMVSHTYLHLSRMMRSEEQTSELQSLMRLS